MFWFDLMLKATKILYGISSAGCVSYWKSGCLEKLSGVIEGGYDGDLHPFDFLEIVWNTHSLP